MLRLKLSLLCSLLVGMALGVQARTVRILAVGNSFSRDAIEQNLAEIAAAAGDTAIIGNLYIGGCSLERHLDNIINDKPDYEYCKIWADGVRNVKLNTSIKEALADEPWDYISVQQVSQNSGIYETFEASLPGLLKYLRAMAPENAEIIIHQTWAYQNGASHPGFKNYNCDRATMYRAVIDAYDRAAEAEGIRIIVPAGTAVENARTSFIGDNMTRDGYHMDLGVGRFTVACVWYEKLFGKNVTENSYIPVGLEPKLARVARMAAHYAVKTPSSVTDLSE